MKRCNITLFLAKSLLKKVKTIAASREKSLSEFWRESLEEKGGEAKRYTRTRER
jgi:hypothetical protein